MTPLLRLVTLGTVYMALTCAPIVLPAQPPAEKKPLPPQSESREQRLIEAVDKKDLAIVNGLLDAGVKPDAKDDRDYTALAHAASVGSVPICEALVRKGAAIDGSDKFTSNPLVAAVVEKHADVVDWLFAHGAHADTTVYCAYSALSTAASTGQINLMKILVEKGALIGPSGDRRSLPLAAAADAGQMAAIAFLLAHGAKVDDTNDNGETALILAAANNQLQAVDLLVARGARVDPTDDQDNSALDLAKGSQKDKIIASLKKAGARETVPNLFRAVKRKDTVMLRSLLDKAADPNVQDSSGKTPIFYTISEVDGSMLKTLIGKGANPNVHDNLGEAVIDLAKKDQDVTAIEELINAGALDPETDLVNAVNANNGVEAAKLLDAKVNPNAVNTNGISALATATSIANEEMVRLLLSKGADVNSADTSGTTALRIATTQGNVGMVRLLLDKGADVKEKTSIFGGILCALGSTNPLPIMKLLIERGASVRDRIKDNGRSVLAVLAGQADAQTFQYLLDHGALADVNAVDDENNTPLQDAAGALNKETVKLSLEHGANPNIASKFSGETPIFYALVSIMRLEKGLDHVPEGDNPLDTPAPAKTEKPEMPKPIEKRSLSERIKDGLAVVQLLASHGARLDIQNRNGKTPMQLALEWESWVDIDALHAAGVKIPTTAPLPRTLGEAADGDDLVGVKQLIKRGDNPNTADKTGYTPLMTAALRGNLEIVTVLLDHGAKPDFRIAQDGYMPETPLFLAADAGHDAVVKLLLKRGANPKLPMGAGNSPLCDAAREGHIESIRLLLDAGLDVNACEKTGLTALMSAVNMFGRFDVAQFLLARGAHVVGDFAGGVSPLMYATESSSPEVVELLIKAGSDVKVHSKTGETALQWAVLSGNLKTVRMIVDSLKRANGNINERNQEKKTALSYALDQHNDEITDLLRKAGATE